MNKKNESLKNTGLFLAFAGPAVFAFMAVVIIPFLYGFYLTLRAGTAFQVKAVCRTCELR
ncbi:MAG: hypothetical protein ACLTLE_02080 [Lachnospiraceae bacterium]